MGRHIIAIDPGLEGAMATYDIDSRILRGLISMPITREVIKRSTIRKIDIIALKKLFDGNVKEYKVTDIIIEAVHSSPQMGVTSAFKFGDTFGITRALATASGCAVHYVPPATWKTKMMLGSKKEVAIEKAKTLFKGSAFFAGKFNKDGQAEAALLAYYAANHIIERDEDPLS